MGNVKLTKSIVIISVNFNTSIYFNDFLESLVRQDNHGFTFRVVIVDNASSSEDFKSLTEIHEKFENKIDIKLIRCTTNVGYSGGLNKGLKQVDVSGADYVIMSNNDLAFSKSFLANLCECAERDTVHVVFPDVVTAGVHHENPRFIKKLGYLRRLAYAFYFNNYVLALLIDFMLSTLKIGNRNRIRPKLLEPTEIYLGVGACFILTKKYFQHYKFLDDSVFLWGEELLLSHQVRSVGGVQMYEPNLIVHHKAHASVDQILGLRRYKMMKKSYNVYKNKY